MQEEIVCYKKEHRVYYYETDKMGRVYHSNFLNWMEETRTEFLRSIGMVYKNMENRGIFLPISEINVKYINPVEYDENVIIILKIKDINRIKIEFVYEFYNCDMTLKFGEAFSINVFSDIHGKLKRAEKELIEKIKIISHLE